MSEEHWLVIGLAHPRAGWFRQMASWATTATVPLDFVKCVSAEEIRARIASGRPYSAALLGSDAVGLDAGLIDLVTTTGAAVATGGISLLARGLWDRLSAEESICTPEEGAERR